MDRCKLCQRGGTLAAVVMARSGGRRRSSSSRQQHRSSESPCSSTRVAPPIIITITINNSKGTQNRPTVNFLFRFIFLFFKVSQMGCAHRLYHEHSRRNVIDTSSINPLWMTTLLPTHFSLDVDTRRNFFFFFSIPHTAYVRARLGENGQKEMNNITRRRER